MPASLAESASETGDRLVALVTGGGKRVGRAIAMELARSGYDVCVHYHHSEVEATEVAEAVTALGQRGAVVGGDLADPESWSRIVSGTVSRLGGLDVLVNNASEFTSSSQDSLSTFDPTLWDRLVRTNLVAPVGLCHHAASWLRRSGRGCVVNLCDIAADRPWVGHLAYCASKGGLVNLTKSLARSMAPDVRVNGVSPGIAIFPESYEASVRDRLIARVPLAREGTPEEVGELVCFLVASAEYITGQVIAIDGGRSVRP